jgi:tetratricopeptide (TPR) repeat protein
VYRDVGRLPEALELATAALVRAVDVGERHFEADALNVLGSVRRELGDLDISEGHHRRALDVARSTDARAAEVTALVGLAEGRRRAGAPEQARRYAEEAVRLAASLGHRVLEGRALTSLAGTTLELGRHADAAGLATRAVDVQRETGSRPGAAQALAVLADALSHSDLDAAHACRDEAARTFRELGIPETSHGRGAAQQVGTASAP